MAELPFLVVHGALVWKAGLVGAGALVLKAASWRRDRASAKFVRRATEHYTSTATGLEPGPILIRGHLRGGGAQSFEHTWLPLVHQRDAGVYLDIEGERIDFDGEIVVGCGTENRTSYWRAPAGAPAIDDPIAKTRGPQRLSLVRADDEVLVAGTLRRAAIGDADYRDSAGGWKLAPFPRQGAVGLVAKHHRARAMPVGPWRSALTFGLTALVTLVGMRACGAIEDDPHGNVDTKIHKLSIAAAMPGTRDDALAELEYVLLNARTPDHVDQAIALREMRQGCASAIDLMADEGRYEQALAASRRCGDPDRELNALLLLGRYDEAMASPALAPETANSQHALVAIANGPLAEAAPYTDTCARLMLTGMGQPGPIPDVLTTSGARCALMGTQLLAPERRLEAALAIDAYDDRDRAFQAAVVDLDRASTPRAAGDLDRAARDLIIGDGGEPAMTVFTSHAGDLTPARAVYEVYRGHFAKAQEIAGALIANAPDPESSAAAQRFAAVVALRTGQPVPAAWLQRDDLLPADSVFRDADLGTALVVARGDASSARMHIGLVDAMAGDGGDLRYDRSAMTLADGLALLAVLPAITTHRDDAVDFMRAVHAEPATPEISPPALVRSAAMRRDLARATGDTETAASWQAVIDRHMAMLDHRDRLLGVIAHSLIPG